MESIVNQETFWREYSVQLNEAKNWDAYQKDIFWTEVAMNMASKTCEKLGIRVDREYYRIDLIGWRGEGEYGDCNWWLDVAFEHENGDTWPEELCKLCYIAADLRVISSYYPSRRAEDRGKDIETTLKFHLDRLGKDKLFRIPHSKWLFVFGPKLVCADKPFKAFTVDEKLSLIPVIGGETVVPAEWKGNC